MSLRALFATCLLTTTVALSAPVVVSEFNQPFLFAYGTWQDRAVVRDGHAVLNAEGLTPRGGAGCNQDLDLAAGRDRTPAIRLRVGPRNTMAVLTLLLRQSEEAVSRFEFALPQPSDQWVTLTARDGAWLDHPNATEKDRPADPAHIMQYQLIGDWSEGKVVDLEVDSISLADTTPEIEAQRGAIRTRETEAAAAKQREQQALRQRYGRRGEQSPWVDHVSAVAPDILSVEVRAQTVKLGHLEAYQPQAGDEKRESKDGKGQVTRVSLVRGGRELGLLIGPGRDQLVTNEELLGDPLLTFLADDLAQYKVSSADDAAFGAGLAPTAVWRKSKPTDWCQSGEKGLAMRHTLYLRLPRALTAGRHYTVTLGELNTRETEAKLDFDPARVRSEAVHVNQVGYRPDDPIKRAYVSIWLGSGGGHKLADLPSFRVVRDGDGQSVLTGRAELALDLDGKEKMFREENFAKTAVYRLDLSALTAPGTYRVVVDGIGCSYPFPIAADVWTRAFLVQMKGLLNERSGVALGPPYTDFVKPRDMHPADGQRVTWLSKSKPELPTEFADPAADTGRAEPQAWGGYHDAGDWNPRRVTHMKVTAAQLELLELFPAKFEQLDWPLPGRDAKVPAVLDEALFEIDCFRRLQTADGGVSFGIESQTDPLEGEVSWLQSMPLYVFAPDMDSSWYYAAMAARASRLLRRYDPARAAVYQQSALRAMNWAEAARTKHLATGGKLDWTWTDHRNIAAIILYDLTGDHHWHDVFLEDSCLTKDGFWLNSWGAHVQMDSAFFYARLKPEQTDAAIRARAVSGLEAQAKSELEYGNGNAFNITAGDRGRPMFVGFFTVPDVIDLARAHYLTGKPEYLAGVVQACGFPLGANPCNQAFTTGLGANPIQHPLHLDSRRTGQPAPAGLTPFGSVDLVRWRDTWITWPITFHLGKTVYPDPYTWPSPEGYWDIYLAPAYTEFTVDIWAGNVHAWGYLAARK